MTSSLVAPPEPVVTEPLPVERKGKKLKKRSKTPTARLAQALRSCLTQIGSVDVHRISFLSGQKTWVVGQLSIPNPFQVIDRSAPKLAQLITATARWLPDKAQGLLVAGLTECLFGLMDPKVTELSDFSDLQRHVKASFLTGIKQHFAGHPFGEFSHEQLVWTLEMMPEVDEFCFICPDELAARLEIRVLIQSGQKQIDGLASLAGWFGQTDHRYIDWANAFLKGCGKLPTEADCDRHACTLAQDRRMNDVSACMESLPETHRAAIRYWFSIDSDKIPTGYRRLLKAMDEGMDREELKKWVSDGLWALRRFLGLPRRS